MIDFKVLVFGLFLLDIVILWLIGYAPRRGYTALVLLAVSSLLFAHVLYYNIMTDDAYITFRYARNWAAGDGLVFNPGERVEGYTSLLWSLMLGVASALGFDIPSVAWFLGLLLSEATLLMTYKLGELVVTKVIPLRTFAILMLASSGSFAMWATGGLETPLFTFLVAVASYLFVISQRQLNSQYVIASAMTWGAAYLARPEGAGLFMLNVLYALLQVIRASDRTRWRQFLIFTAIGSAVVVGHVFWRLVYYGYPLPNTFYAKVGSDWSTQMDRGAMYVWDFIKTYGYAFLPLLAPLPRKSLFRFPSSFFLFLSVGYLGYVVLVGGEGLFNFRFLVPVLPLLYVVGQWHWDALLSALAFARSGRRWTTGLSQVLIVCCSLLTLYPSSRGLYVLSGTTQGSAWSNLATVRKTYQNWRLAGIWLGTHTAKNTTLAIQPAGYMPFYSKRHIIDMLGLNDLHIAHLPGQIGGGKSGHEKWDGDYVLARQPDIIILSLGVHSEPIQNLSSPAEIERVIQPRRVDWEILRSPEFTEWYIPESARLANGNYLNFFRRLDYRRALEDVTIQAGIYTTAHEVILEQFYDEAAAWSLPRSNNVSGQFVVSNGITTLEYANTLRHRDTFGYVFKPSTAITNVVALRLRLKISKGTYFTIAVYADGEWQYHTLRYYRGRGDWEIVETLVDVARLDRIYIGIGEPAEVRDDVREYKIMLDWIVAIMEDG